MVLVLLIMIDQKKRGGFMRINRKGQAAMEFLMTYGWALLVVLVAIGALAFFGVLNPAQFLPSSCTLFPGLSCSEFIASGANGNVQIQIQNGLGDDIDLLEIAIAGDCDASGTRGTLATLPDGSTDILTVVCSGLTATDVGSRFKEDLTVTYTIDPGFTHTRTGQMVTEIE